MTGVLDDGCRQAAEKRVVVVVVVVADSNCA